MEGDKMLGENARLALDTIHQKPVKGIPTWLIHIMEHSQIERIAGVRPGDYERNPEEVYLKAQRAIGASMIDQYMPRNPLQMGDEGYRDADPGATTGATEIVVDGRVIDSPEAVVEHMETVLFPKLEEAARAPYDVGARAKGIIDGEESVQKELGPEILKVPYGQVRFPYLDYCTYGYVHYFTAYALYADVIERCFSLMADAMLPNNTAVAKAYQEGGLPPMLRLDHDLADSRGILVGIESLEKLWFPHFVRAIEPVLKAGVRLIWHCDGNLMDLVGPLIDAGLCGFQGFQYESGMDYEKICRMKTREGEDLIIIGGVSVTRTLPFGTPRDVKKEIDWLAANGPKTGLFLGCSSSVTPGVPWENIEVLIEGFHYYRTHGRG
jgi:hypothetical protein